MTPTTSAAPRATGILEFVDLAEVGVIAVPDRPGVAAAVLAALASGGLNTPFVVEMSDPAGRSSMIVCVHRQDLDPALAAIRAVAGELRAERVEVRRGVAVAAVHGPHFRERPGCAAAACAAIAAAGVNILAISTSLASIACMVAAGDLDATVRALTATFGVPDGAVMIAGDGLSRPVGRCPE